MGLDNEDVLKIFKEGGLPVQCSAIDCLRSNGWDFLMNPYYIDYISGKPRETDIIAEKTFNLMNGGKFTMQLFIECKYINKPIVFLFDKKDTARTKKFLADSTPIYSEFNLKYHHYYQEESVAKSFAFKRSQKDEYDDLIYKAINQCLHGMLYSDYEISNNRFSIYKQGSSFYKKIFSVSYPLIICDNFSNFFRVDGQNLNNSMPIDQNFQLEINYAYFNKENKQKSSYFLIDIVDINKFTIFLQNLEKNDRQAIRSSLENHIKY